MRSTYGSVLRRPRVLAVLVPYALGRLPQSMMTLALLLMVRSQTSSFSRAGTLAAVFGAAGAAGSPLLARLVDRRGPRRVLLPAGAMHALALTLCAMSVGTEFPLAVAAAAVGGATVPPLSGCIRATWTRLLDDEAARTAAFALDGIVIEVAELTAPLVVGAAVALGRPQLAVIGGGALTALAAVGFALVAPPVETQPTATGSRWGALAVPGVRRALVLVLLLTCTIGGVEVVVTACARGLGVSAAAGPLLAVSCVGGLVGGAVYGRRRSPWPTARVVALVLPVVAVSAAALGPAPTLAVAAAALAVYGAAVAVAVVALTGAIAASAPEDVRTESFAWASTANFLGVALGTLVAGWLLDAYGVRAAAVVAGAPAVLAAVLAPLVRQRTESPSRAELEEQVRRLEEELAATRAALDSALAEPPHLALLREAEARAEAMLARADADCAVVRERAEEDAARVRAVATEAAIEIMRAAERDATAILRRARRSATDTAADAHPISARSA